MAEMSERAGRCTTEVSKVVINLPGPAVGPDVRQVRAPDQVLRIWAMLNAAHGELQATARADTPAEMPGLRQSLLAARTELERSVSVPLAAELGRLLRGQMPSSGPDELRVECASLLGWTGGLVLEMLGQLEAAADTARGAHTAATPMRSLPGSDPRIAVDRPPVRPDQALALPSELGPSAARQQRCYILPAGGKC